jgi:hypothetical protein
MANPMIKTHDIETNEVIEREMTDAELDAIAAAQTAAQTNLQAESSKAAEKAALLEKLGITADEAALLLS